MKTSYTYTGLALALLCAVSLLSFPALIADRHMPARVSKDQSDRTPIESSTARLTSEQTRESYGQIEMGFEANPEQTGSGVNFLARSAGYTLFLKPTEAVFVLARHEGRGKTQITTAQSSAEQFVKTRGRQGDAFDTTIKEPSKVLRMKLVGADKAAAVKGADELPGKVNYFIGNDPAKWRANVPTFGRARYAQVYPGVDVVYYGNQRQLEYDLVVAPSADAGAIKLQFDGADKVEVDAAGDLLLTLGESVIRQPKPFVYQEVAGERHEVEGRYAVGARGQVGFTVGEYDATLPLVIDPTLVYSTYLGGSGGDQAWAVKVDSTGSAYIAGYTTSTNFPTANAVQAANGGFQDAFVSKLNAAGTALIYSTYLGGNGTDQARGLAIDSAGNAYVTGFTSSTNFPIANAIQSTVGTDGQDAFVTKINATGSALVYSTYLGGSNSSEFGEDIAVDSAGNAYATGETFSNNFPVVNAIQSTFGGFTDAYVTKINAAGSALVYSTYLGGSDREIGEGIIVDSAGNAYVTGDTSSTNFPLANAVQGTYGGAQDAFVTKLNAAGSAFVYSTYLGGSAQDDGESVAADAAGNAYVTGDTFSTNFPTANAFQPANGGVSVTQDAFVTKLNSAGSALIYSTYLGGTGGEVGNGIAVDAAGNAYVTGGTASTNSFPTANAIQCARAGGSDVFITKINAAGTALVYSTYLGGSASGSTIEQGRGIAIDSSGNAYVAGGVNSTDFPTVNPIQSTYAGSDFGLAGDAFVLKLNDTTTGPASQLAFTQTAPGVQEDLTFFTLTVARTGDLSGPVTVDYATSDGTASERSDYTTAIGTLRFGVGESSKTLDILVNEDSKVEGNETFTVSLSNPTGGATLSCLTAVATVQITDDGTEPSTNVIDDAAIFTGTHYHDFLNRQADAVGLNFWANQITACGADGGCVDRARTNVSQAFFLSIEFQQTGFLVFRFYKESFIDSAARPRGMPRYREFLRDTQEIGRGVVVNTPGWELVLEANKQAFARQWVQRAEFVALFPTDMTAAAFVDKLFQNAQVTPTQAERDAAIAAFGAGGTDGRAAALRSVADSGSVFNRQFNSAFVLAQYIGYLRRNPNDAPEPGLNYAGFDFWLAKLDSVSQPGEDVRNEGTAIGRVKRAEMVRAFIVSTEYRQRFGP